MVLACFIFGSMRSLVRIKIPSLTVSRLFNSRATGNLKVCIVGSGPAGFYTAQHLIKNDSSVQVDMYERLPVPFGLVRYGVAPDHADVKNVTNTFSNVAQSGRLNFMGNINIGKDVSLKELCNAYHAVVLAYGAAQDRWLGIPGENLGNVMPARKFVSWYNGAPEEANLNIDFDTETAVIIGHGNVAIDTARILLTPVDILKKTDIAEHAVEALMKSRIKLVKMIGRRGPLQVAFTIKELRELSNLPATKLHIHMDSDWNSLYQSLGVSDACLAEDLLKKVSRPRRRLTELMMKVAGSQGGPSTGTRQCQVDFQQSPVQFNADQTESRVQSLVVAINRLSGDPHDPIVQDTGSRHTIQCGLVIKSIGYKSVPLADELPFDHAKGVIKQHKSRVLGLPGVYCSGWVGTGAVGVIASTLQSGHDTGRAVLEDAQNGDLDAGHVKPAAELIGPLLKSRNVTVVTFQDWLRIDEEERQRGSLVGKPRQKEICVQNMLNVAKRS